MLTKTELQALVACLMRETELDEGGTWGFPDTPAFRELARQLQKYIDDNDYTPFDDIEYREGRVYLPVINLVDLLQEKLEKLLGQEETPEGPDSRARALQLLTEAMRCHHGEIFADCYGDAPRKPFVEWSAACAQDQRDMAKECDEDGSWIPAAVTNHEQAMTFWKAYFAAAASHGEWAGMVARQLHDGEHWADLVSILEICGDGGFGWDS